MRAMERLADRVAQGLALIGAVGLMALLLHVAAEVLARNLFSRPIPATNQIVSHYYMVLIAFLPLAWVERQGAMISVELTEGFMSPRMKRLSDGVVAVLAVVIYAALAWVTWADAMKAWRVGSFVDVLGYRLPIWPTYFLPPAGFFLAAAVMALRGVAVLRGETE